MSVAGFTGSRLGPTLAQIAQVETWLFVYRPDAVHHGDCIGADEWFHKVCAATYRKHRPTIYVHPPSEDKYRAYCEGDYIEEPKTYHRRNQDIVNAATFLIAVPAQNREIKRSGTWSTVRKAEKRGIPIHIVYPNGNVELR